MANIIFLPLFLAAITIVTPTKAFSRTEEITSAVLLKRRLNLWALELPESQTLPANLPAHTTFFRSELEERVESVSCEAPVRQDLSVCLWQRKADSEEPHLVIMDQEGEAGERVTMRDTTYLSGSAELKDGKCALSTTSVPGITLSGDWICALVTKDRTVFTGKIRISEAYGLLWGLPASHGQSGFNSRHTFYPHQASLQSSDGQEKHFCGATIIHPFFLVSAAHCFKDYQPPYIQAVAGEFDIKKWDGTEQVRNVARLIIHEEYNRPSKWDNDIALVVLNEPILFDEKYVRPIPLYSSEWELPVSAYVSGWGYGSSSSKLEYAWIHIRDHKNCTEKWGRSGFTVTNNMICAGGTRDACKGDSGGPLTCAAGTEAEGTFQHYLCGIVSWGQDCENRKTSQFPGLYMDVRKYNEWVTRQMALTFPGAQLLPATHVPQRTVGKEAHDSADLILSNGSTFNSYCFTQLFLCCFVNFLKSQSC